MIPLIDATEAVARLERSVDIDPTALAAVQAIIADVRTQGDTALFSYTQRFDGFPIDRDHLIVTEDEFARAYESVPPALLETMRTSARRIRAFHEKQIRQSWFTSQDGTFLGQLIRPLHRVGIYVPGGRAAYPSSVLMNALPAAVAGVREIVMATPPGSDGSITPLTLVAARESGVSRVYKMGGAQAVAALAYGTESVPRVDKITGPGNLYVALAKREVFGQVGIDMVAGPSEVLVLADDSAPPAYVAADLIAQAEHDPLAAAILITDSATLASAVQAEIETQLAQLPREAIARESIEKQSGIVVVDDLRRDGLPLSNAIAPEHLEIMARDPFSYLDGVENAGAIFLGQHAPESLGDYLAGPNHVLPTNHTARFFSPLSVDDFIKKSSVIHFNREALLQCAPDVIAFARAEGLDGHAHSAALRMEGEQV